MSELPVQAPREQRRFTDHRSRSNENPSSPSSDVNLSPFSEEEQNAILTVVKRDLEVRCMEKQRLKKIRKGILEEDIRAPLALPGTAQTCALCGGRFVFLIKAKLICDLCRREICRNCSKTNCKEILCSICYHDIFYQAMACHWFYDPSPEKPRTYASNTIVRNLFKGKLPSKTVTAIPGSKMAMAVSDLDEDQLYTTLSNYLKPENKTYINGKVITREVLKKTQNDQIMKFSKRYKEVRSRALNALGKVRANSSQNTPEDTNREIERITQQFTQQTKEALRKLLQVLCITEEKYRISLDNPKGDSSVRVLQITQRQVESLVGHQIKVPDEFVRADVNDDLDSFVESVTGGPEDFFANILLEDLKNALRTSQSNGTIPPMLAKE